jgi:hypothetical protein
VDGKAVKFYDKKVAKLDNLNRPDGDKAPDYDALNAPKKTKLSWGLSSAIE